MSRLTDLLCPDWVIHISPEDRRALLDWWARVATSPDGIDLVGTRPPGFSTREDVEAWAGVIQKSGDRGREALPELSFTESLGVPALIGIGAHHLLTTGTDCTCCHSWRTVALAVLCLIGPVGAALLGSWLTGWAMPLALLAAGNAFTAASLVLVCYVTGREVLGGGDDDAPIM